MLKMAKKVSLNIVSQTIEKSKYIGIFLLEGTQKAFWTLVKEGARHAPAPWTWF